MIYALEPWDLENLIPFADNYLSGFVTEKYQIDLAEGFMVAQDIAEKKIIMDIFEDIGEDEQSLTASTSSMTTSLLNALPAYICAYRYNGKVYRFMVNGRTGEVQGEGLGWIKILLLIIAIIAAIALISICCRATNADGLAQAHRIIIMPSSFRPIGFTSHNAINVFIAFVRMIQDEPENIKNLNQPTAGSRCKCTIMENQIVFHENLSILTNQSPLYA